MAIREAGPESLNGLVLAAHDFDETIALTSTPLEGGYTVTGAYQYAVEKVLGEPALDEYINTGGLRNRAPSEVVDQLSTSQDPAFRRQQTEDLVAEKLGLLTRQIGKRLTDGRLWPPLNDGFSTYWSMTKYSKVVTAVISSGHEAFIRKTFEIHDTPEPQVFVTDDDMRPVMNVLPRVACEKPSRLLIDTATERWLRIVDYVGLGALSLDELQAISSQNVVYAGDDKIKDGQLAANANATFVHIRPGDSLLGYAKLCDAVGLKIMAGANVARA